MNLGCDPWNEREHHLALTDKAPEKSKLCRTIALHQPGWTISKAEFSHVCACYTVHEDFVTSAHCGIESDKDYTHHKLVSEILEILHTLLRSNRMYVAVHGVRCCEHVLEVEIDAVQDDSYLLQDIFYLNDAVFGICLRKSPGLRRVACEGNEGDDSRDDIRDSHED